MKFTLLQLDHARIGDDLQIMQFGGFDGRIKRIKAAVKAGLHHDPVAIESSSRATVEAIRDIGTRALAIGDLLRDPDGKIWMLDHTGWASVTTQIKSVFPDPLKTP